MGTRLRLLLVAFLFLTGSAPLYAETSSWNELTREVLSLHRTGQYENALEVAHLALAVARKNFDPRDQRVAASLNNLGEISRALGNYRDAHAFFSAALEIWRRDETVSPRTIASCLNNIGSLHFSQGNYAVAEIDLKAALRIRQN
jgi:tetratricopeptide (TPR) repeat protein